MRCAIFDFVPPKMEVFSSPHSFLAGRGRRRDVTALLNLMAVDPEWGVDQGVDLRGRIEIHTIGIRQTR